MEGDNFGTNRGGLGDPELSGDDYENVDPEKEIEEIKRRLEVLSSELDKNPADQGFADERDMLTKKLNNLEGSLSQDY